MSIEVTHLTRVFGAVVNGVDLTARLPQSTIDRLSELLVERKVLLFRNQEITPQAQRDFAARFGTLHVHPIYPVLPDLPEILLLDNHEAFLPDNDNWHTDVTFFRTPPLAGILAAKRIPSVGGDTLWSDSTAAYEALSAPLHRFLDGLTAQHSVAKSFPAERWQSDPGVQGALRAGRRQASARRSSRDPHASGQPSQGPVRRTRDSRRTSTSVKPRESEALLKFPVRARRAARIHHTLALDRRRRGVLGQSQHPALRRGGLPPRAAHHASRHGQRRRAFLRGHGQPGLPNGQNPSRAHAPSPPARCAAASTAASSQS